MKLKNKIFIVDDWGMSKETNDSILDLAEKGLLYGVSLLVDSPFFTYKLDSLKAIKSISLGLHFNLSENWNDKDRFFKSSLFKIFIPSKIKTEFGRQISIIKKNDIEIKYLDGHHHIHLLPWVYHNIHQFIIREKISVRVIRDISHLPSFVLSFLTILIYKPFMTGYIPICATDIKSIKNKIMNTDRPLVIHIEKENRFRENNSDHRYRVNLYHHILNIYGF